KQWHQFTIARSLQQCPIYSIKPKLPYLSHRSASE
ncbi:hypothetical protein ACZ87_02032, partial [Candidatus Erwinia dacicola]